MDINLGYTQDIIKVAKDYGLLRNELAYVLATAYHETAHTMKPVKEAYWLKNAEEWRKRNLRYYPWYGRGFVQLTWEANYKKAGDKIGVDLIKNKDLALDPIVAARILVVGMIEAWFTKYKLSDFINIGKSDYVGARRIINGTDKADLIAGYAKLYEKDLLAAGYGVVKPQEVVQAGGPPYGIVQPVQEERSTWLDVVKLLVKAFSK